MRVRRSLASPGLLKFLAHPTLGPPIAKAFSLNQDLMTEASLSHSSALADKCSTRPVHDLDEVKKLQLRAEFLDYRDPVRCLSRDSGYFQYFQGKCVVLRTKNWDAEESKEE